MALTLCGGDTHEAHNGDISHSYIVSDNNSHIQAQIKTRAVVNNVKLIHVFQLQGGEVMIPNSDEGERLVFGKLLSEAVS